MAYKLNDMLAMAKIKEKEKEKEQINSRFDSNLEILDLLKKEFNKNKELRFNQLICNLFSKFDFYEESEITLNKLKNKLFNSDNQ